MAGAAGSPQGGRGNAGGVRLGFAVVFIFALVCYIGFQDLRVRRDSETKGELDGIYGELQRVVANLKEERMRMAALKSNTTLQLQQSELQRAKLQASLGDKDNMINDLKMQLKDNETEMIKLRKRLKELEEQLELFKANTTTGSGGQDPLEESREELRKQGEDLDHGLVAADKAEVDERRGAEEGNLEATKSEEVDDRKREQIDVETDKVDEDLDAVKALSQDGVVHTKAEDELE